MAAPQPNTSREVPRYQLLEKCYLRDKMYDPESMPLDMDAEPLDDGTQPRKPLIVAFDGVPAHYMKPVNDAARAQCAKYPERMSFLDPVNALNIVGPGAADIKQIAESTQTRNR